MKPVRRGGRKRKPLLGGKLNVPRGGRLGGISDTIGKKPLERDRCARREARLRPH